MTSRRVYRGGPADGQDDADDAEPSSVVAGMGDSRQWPIGHYLPTNEYDDQERRVYEWDGGDGQEH